MRRIRRLLLGCLVLMLVILPVVDGGGQALPNYYAHSVVESTGGTHEFHQYVINGKVYFKYENSEELWTHSEEDMSMMMEVVSSLDLDDYDAEILGKDEVAGRQATHHQVFSKTTGLIMGDSWVDEETGITLQSISYDENGVERTRTTVVKLDVNPDFSDVDFNSAHTLTRFQPIRTITEEEFKQLVPWYDLSSNPPYDMKLSGLSLDPAGRKSGWVTVNVEYSNESAGFTVNIHGTLEVLAMEHGPSEFDKLRREEFFVAQGGYGISSRRTGVILAIKDGLNESDALDFLHTLVIHPASLTK